MFLASAVFGSAPNGCLHGQIDPATPRLERKRRFPIEAERGAFERFAGLWERFPGEGDPEAAEIPRPSGATSGYE